MWIIGTIKPCAPESSARLMSHPSAYGMRMMGETPHEEIVLLSCGKCREYDAGNDSVERNEFAVIQDGV